MELGLLKDIVIIFALSTVVNLVFTKLKVPTVVGYLITGILAGPYILSLVTSKHEIELLAEIGVIFLLFTIGLEFSLKHLLKIRKIVFLGGLMQVTITAGAFYLATKFYDIDWKTGIFIGFIAALSSSALVLKLLQERSELTSNYGRTILGILIFQDILLVPLLLFTNIMGNSDSNILLEVLILLGKAVLIIGLVFVGNKWILPKLMHFIAATKNQELFMMFIFLVCLGVALLTSELGMSLAFGAFLAGLMVSDTRYSHNTFSDFIPFKDIFSSFFFVSIGMLLDLNFVITNYQIVILTVLLVLGVKTFIAGATGFVLGHTFKGTILVGLALSQVGEFSFILAKLGLSHDILNDYYYQLFIAVAVITMSITPFLMKISVPFAHLLLRLPLPKFLVEGIFPLPEISIPELHNHLVIIGKDASALKLSRMAKMHQLKHVSIIFDPKLVQEKIKNNDLVIYGDATNEPILEKAHVQHSDLIVISVSNILPSMAILESIRHINKHAYIIVRTKNTKTVEDLYKAGADQVIPEKLEIAIDIFTRVLLKKLYPQKEVNRIITHLRNQNLGELAEKDIKNQPSIFDDLPNMNISAVRLEAESMAENKSMQELKFRNRTGATLLAIKRGDKIIEHPEPDALLLVNDIVYILGNPEQTNMAYELFST